jgi:hypothetical protein
MERISQNKKKLADLQSVTTTANSSSIPLREDRKKGAD